MEIIAVANLKGGVGKTVTTHTLGAVLAQDRSVLLIDADPQGSLTGACGIDQTEDRSLAEILSRGRDHLPLRDVIRDLDKNLALVPAGPELAVAERALASHEEAESVLKDSLSTLVPDRGFARPFSAWTTQSYDVVLIDTSPSLGLLTINALTAATGVLIPTIPEIVGLSSLRLFLDKMDEIKRTLNPRLRTIGILATFFDKRLLHHKAVMEVMRLSGLPLLDVTIGRSVRVAEAVASGETVVTYAPVNPRAVEYWVLGEVVRGWLDDRRH